MKEGKAVEVDDIPAEMLKSLEEKALRKICEICHDIHKEGKWPVPLSLYHFRSMWRL
jgi:hypothetical protein